LIDEILDLLNRSPLLNDLRVWQRDEAPSGAFVLKVRCRVGANFVLQVWLNYYLPNVRYSYQLTANETVLRWDNAPHFPGLRNFPHHFHDAKGKKSPSVLRGDPIKDLSFVLLEAEKYLEP
jgi:hypothetical protein